MSEDKEDQGIARRAFLSAGLSAVGGLVAAGAMGPAALAASEQEAGTVIDVGALKSRFKFQGAVLTPQDKNFNEEAVARVWNELRPERRPQIIAQVTGDDDVIAAVKFARANKVKIAVRGGGHNWCNPSLRTSGMMLDLSNLTGVVSIDEADRKAVVNPILSNREVQAALNPKGLAYPSGHCPQVKMSGYLLSGGMAWNHGVWGPGVGSIEAIELVNARGELITADARQNQDYFWAARGGGSGFFGVALRYHLKLYPLPKAITASVYYYPYEDIVEIAKWLEPIARKLPPAVELSLFAVEAPPELQEQARSANGKVALVTGTMFADDKNEAAKVLALLDSCPLLSKCMKKSIAQPTTFPELFDASGALWPEHLRCKVDAMFFDVPPADLFQSTYEHFKRASKDTVLMYAVFTGPAGGPKTPADAAFSMTANLYGGPWTMWKNAGDDSENIKWHDECVKILLPKVKGHYISETDTVSHPEYIKKSYNKGVLERMAELRKKHDPDGVFFDYSSGLS